jgi:hypothetical protein
VAILSHLPLPPPAHHEIMFEPLLRGRKASLDQKEGSMAAWVWILIVIAAVVAVAVIAMVARQRRTTALRQRFGPEYDRAMEAREGRGPAEAELRDREKQRARLDIRPLPEDMRVRFAEEWREVQERFVDQPSEAVVAADRLVYSVMETRGYPMGDFDAQADLVSVDHPEVVENYRVAHGIRERAHQQQASTEDLREAMLRYRSLFDELLKAGDGRAGVTARRGPGGIADQSGADRSGPDADGHDAAGSPDASREETEVSRERL